MDLEKWAVASSIAGVILWGSVITYQNHFREPPMTEEQRQALLDRIDNYLTCSDAVERIQWRSIKEELDAERECFRNR